MSDDQAILMKIRPSPRHPAGAGLGILHRLIMVPSEGRKRRRAIAELERLDDRMLADIGISRCEIPQVVDGLTFRNVELAFPESPDCGSHYVPIPIGRAA